SGWGGARRQIQLKASHIVEFGCIGRALEQHRPSADIRWLRVMRIDATTRRWARLPVISPPLSDDGEWPPECRLAAYGLLPPGLEAAAESGNLFRQRLSPKGNDLRGHRRGRHRKDVGLLVAGRKQHQCFVVGQEVLDVLDDQRLGCDSPA